MQIKTLEKSAKPGGPLRAMLLIFGLAGLLSVSGCRPSSPTGGNTIAIATTYLESAARDILGEDAAVLRLAEPGTCPGHFDIRPSQAAELRRCRALLRFDFQSSLDRVLTGNETNRPIVISVSIQDGLCLPCSYFSACRQIADAFVAQGWLERTNAHTRLQAISERLNALVRNATNRIAQAGLKNQAVIASVHQKDFCEWLGLKVVATFRAADIASVAEIDDTIRAGKLAEVRLAVANLPEGRRTADALARRLNARVAVLGNFPTVNSGRVSFDDLLSRNVEEILNTAGP